MSTHTPGPWLMADEGAFVYALNLEGSNRFSASVQQGWATGGRLRTEAGELVSNARLIAAAPELLEALIAARDYVTTALREEREKFAGHEHCSDIATVESDLAAIDAAIAKATGEPA